MKLLLILLLFTTATIQAQTDFNITGTWKVTGFTLPEGIGPDDMESYKKGEKVLLQSKFVFKEDHRFSFITPDESLTMVNVRWSYDPENKGYLVDEWNTTTPTGELMALRVVQRSGKTHFLMDDGDMLMAFIVERE